ncbi:hypothetical protein AB0M20_14095, partial [Actinoplanes sp. NPDC051633]|uniref:hypothetical protein n=1 Tax=Actinoplanes sp. NPDC051633 TaxID=3155670 RepID=UPI00343850E9
MSALAVEHVTMPVLGRLAPHATRAEQIAHIAEAARQIRIQDLKLVHHAGAGQKTCTLNVDQKLNANEI